MEETRPSGDLATFVALQAQELLASAKGDADAIRAKAYEEGLLAANEEAARIILQAQGILHEVQAWRDEILTQGEASIMALVLQIGKKVFGEGIDLDPENLQKNVEQALALAKPLGDLHIHLHPDDVEKNPTRLDIHSEPDTTYRPFSWCRMEPFERAAV